MPAVTATAAPPLEPPAERLRSHGLNVGPPLRVASVVGAMHSSGTFERANGMRPAASKRSVRVALRAERVSPNSLEPILDGRRTDARPESLSRNGMPPKVPRGFQFLARSKDSS